MRIFSKEEHGKYSLTANSYAKFTICRNRHGLSLRNDVVFINLHSRVRLEEIKGCWSSDNVSTDRDEEIVPLDIEKLNLNNISRTVFKSQRTIESYCIHPKRPRSLQSVDLEGVHRRSQHIHFSPSCRLRWGANRPIGDSTGDSWIHLWRVFL